MIDVVKSFETVCSVNDDIIKSNQEIIGASILIRGDEEVAEQLIFNKYNKKLAQTRVKEMVIQLGLDAYILVLPYYKEVNGAKLVIRSLFTPTVKATEFVWYSDGLILNKERLIGRRVLNDNFGVWLWDAWRPKINVTVKLD